MAGEALFIGWGAVVRGREKQAVQVFQESMEYYGDRKALAEIRFSDEFERLVARASAIIDSLGVLPAYGGDALAQRMGLLQEVADEFGG